MSEAAVTPRTAASPSVRRVGRWTFEDRLFTVVVYLAMALFSLTIIYPFWYLSVSYTHLTLPTKRIV